MDSKIYRRYFDAGKARVPIRVFVDITQVAQSGANRVRTIRLPFSCKIVGGTVMADGTLGSNKTISISQGYVSAGDIGKLGKDLDAWTATDLTAKSITVTAASANPALIKGVTVTTMLEAFLTGDSNYVTSGSANDTAAPTGTSVRSRCEMKEDDILTISLPASGDANVPVYHLELWLLPDYVVDTTKMAIA